MAGDRFDAEAAVLDTYGDAARRDRELCCPVSLNPQLLSAIPPEVIERDYGCGDPTRHVRPGETVHLQRNPELWTGCISGAMREDDFLAAFEKAGMYGITVVERTAEPWRTVQGIEFRSVTVIAYKGKEGACLDRKQAVVYRGPSREVTDDDGHVLRRGARVAVCEKTFGIYSKLPYREHFDLVEPRISVPIEAVRPFPCGVGTLIRDPRETKGEGYLATTEAGPICKPGSGCC
jgi:hypothetical protein